MIRPTRRRLWGLGVLCSLPVTLWLIDRACFTGAGHPPPHQRVAGLFAPARPVMPGTVAVLVNAGVSPRMNHSRYWNNTSLVYSTLKTLGYERLMVLQSDGDSREPDRQSRSFLGLVGTGHLVNSPADLDSDGRADIAGPGTAEALRATLHGVGRTLAPEGRLLLFITGHGQLRVRGGVHSVALMWGAGELRGAELDRMLRSTVPDDRWVAIVATQCHSKRFLDEVTRPRTLLVASGWPLWMWSTQDYGVFPYHLAAAMLGRDPATGRALAGGADSNLRAAVETARRHDHAPEWPRLWINGDATSVPRPF